MTTYPGQSTNTLPVGSGTTVGTVSQPILGTNPTRTGVIFHNPGGVAVAICPGNLNVGALGVYSTPPPSTSTAGVAVINGAGSITMAPGDKFIFDNLPCGCAWNGVAAGAGGVITILEFL